MAAYAGFTLLLIFLTASLVLFSTTLPNALEYLLMPATLGWLTQGCDEPGLRGGISR